MRASACSRHCLYIPALARRVHCCSYADALFYRTFHFGAVHTGCRFRCYQTPVHFRTFTYVFPPTQPAPHVTTLAYDRLEALPRASLPARGGPVAFMLCSGCSSLFSTRRRHFSEHELRAFPSVKMDALSTRQCLPSPTTNIPRPLSHNTLNPPRRSLPRLRLRLALPCDIPPCLPRAIY